MKLRRNDAIDKVRDRYIESFSGLTDLEDQIGHEAHSAMVNEYLSGLKIDLKSVKIEIEKSEQFDKKRVKHEFFIEKLNLIPLSEEEFSALPYFARKRYLNKQRKAEREFKKWRRIVLKYKEFISEEEYLAQLYGEQPEEEVETLETTEDPVENSVETPQNEEMSAEDVTTEQIEQVPDAENTDLSAQGDGADAPATQETVETVSDVESTEELSTDERLEEFYGE